MKCVGNANTTTNGNQTNKVKIMSEPKERIAGELDATLLARKQVKYNVHIALRYYRYLNAFVLNAVDSMEFYISDRKIPASVKSIADSRAETLVIITHIRTAIETYRELCKADGNEDKAKVIIYKFIDPDTGADGRGKPFTNEQLAEHFNRDIKTISAWLSEGYKKIGILLFGIHAFEKTTR